MKRRMMWALLLLVLAVLPGAADVDFLFHPERTVPIQFQYESGRWRREGDPTVPVLFMHAWEDTTDLGIEAEGYFETLTADGDTVGNWYWEDVEPGVYYIVETTGPDSVFSHPQYLRLGWKTPPDDWVSGDAIQDEAIDSEHLADSLISEPHHIKRGVLRGLHIADGEIGESQIATGAVLTRHILDEQVTMGKLAPDVDGYLTLTYPVRGDSAAASDTLEAFAIQSTRHSTQGPVRILAQSGADGDLTMRKMYTTEGWYWGTWPAVSWYVEEDEAVLPGYTRYSPTITGDSLAIVSASTRIRGGKVRIGTQSASTADSLIVRNRSRFAGRATFDNNVYTTADTELGADSSDAVLIKGAVEHRQGRMVRGSTTARAYDVLHDGDGQTLTRGTVDLDRDEWGEIAPMRFGVIEADSGHVYIWEDSTYDNKVLSWYVPGVDSTWIAHVWHMPNTTVSARPMATQAFSSTVATGLRYVSYCVTDSARISWETSIANPSGKSFSYILWRPGTP